LGVHADGLPVVPQAVAAASQVLQMGSVESRVDDLPVDPGVQLDQGAVVAPHLQVAEVDVLQDGGGGVVVAGGAAQLELGQLRPQVLQAAPRLAGVRIWV
jgi:hypothetical protein